MHGFGVVRLDDVRQFVASKMEELGGDPEAPTSYICSAWAIRRCQLTICAVFGSSEGAKCLFHNIS